MGLRLRNLVGVLVLAVASTSILAQGAIAQPDTSSLQPIPLETIPDAFNRAFFNDSGDIFRNNTVQRQFEYIFGPGSFRHSAFPDNEFVQDAQVIYTLYRDALEQQVSSDPIIRTPDLPNPFDTSLRMLPNPYGRRVKGSEFVYEKVPLR